MANVVRVRVELKKKHPDAWRNFKEMLKEFEREVGKSGVKHDHKIHQFYESKSEKKRRKRREAAKKCQMQQLEEKILAGERVKAPSGIIKKILNSHKKGYYDKGRNEQ